jgi:glycosyltransferase involved in cell wall biosynthesis
MDSLVELQCKPFASRRLVVNAMRGADCSHDSRPVICHVLNALHVGGAEVLARAFALEQETEFRPVFAILDELGCIGRDLRDAGYIVEVSSREPGFDPGCARRLGRFFRKHGVSLVHAHNNAPLFYSALARMPWLRLPILLTEHGRDFPDYRRWKRVLANRLLLGRCDRFVAVGEDVRQALIKYEGLPAERVEVIYNGSNLSGYDARRPLRRAVRAELRLDSDSLVIIQVARLNRLKDHPTALHAMKRLRATMPNAKLLLVGDGEERPAVERLIGELALTDSVRVLGTRHDVPRLLQAADVFLLTSVSEGIPLTLIEAMATGLPCVATRVGGVPEVVIDRHTGLLAEVSNPESVAVALQALAAAPATREHMGQNGLARAKQQFDHEQMHSRYRQIYQEMLP